MEIAKLILEYLRTIIYPAIIVGIVIFFRKAIIKLLESITRFKGFGVEAEIDRKLQVAADNISSEEVDRQETERKKEKQLSVINETGLRNIAFEIQTNLKKEDRAENTMLAFAVGTSYEENLKYGIYYDPVQRNHNFPFKYIGLYTGKVIIAVGELKKIVKCDYVNNELVPTYDQQDLSELTNEEKTRLKAMMENAKHDVTEDHKFFIVDKFYDTTFAKTTPYALQAKRYFWLNDIEGFNEGMSAEELANLLKKQTWE